MGFRRLDKQLPSVKRWSGPDVVTASLKSRTALLHPQRGSSLPQTLAALYKGKAHTHTHTTQIMFVSTSRWRCLFHTPISAFISFIRGRAAHAGAAQMFLWKVLVTTVHQIRNLKRPYWVGLLGPGCPFLSWVAGSAAGSNPGVQIWSRSFSTDLLGLGAPHLMHFQ